jgi:hypothetical protein
MMLDLLRYNVKGQTVFGVLYDNCFGFGHYFTIERKQTLIPEGLYVIRLTYSPKFRRQLPIISNFQVKESRGIRMHAGNSVDDSSGCILVGNNADLVSMTIGDSQRAVDQLVIAIRKWQKQGKTSPTLYVKDAI